MKSKDLKIGEAYALGDKYEAQRGALRRAVLVDKLPGGFVLVDAPKRDRWSNKPDGEIARIQVRSYYLNHTWAEELVAKAARDERKATDDALKARADAAGAAIAAALPEIERPVYIDKAIGFGYGARLTLEALERVAEMVTRLRSLEK